MDRLDEMYAAQRDLQEQSFKYDFSCLSHDRQVTYIKDMVLALTSELHELLNETSWKPWTAKQFINQHEYRKELVDAFHFLMNLMLAVNMTPDELYTGYLAKRKINEERQRTGYDGVSTKMPCCQRAVEDVSFTEVRKLDGTLDFVICVCGDRVDGEFIKRNAELLPDLQIS